MKKGDPNRRWEPMDELAALHQFEEAHRAATCALQRLSELWEFLDYPENVVKQYPGYLPDFREFVSDFTLMLDPKEVKSDNEKGN